MNREFIHIDGSRCIRCGNCAADCPTNLLEMTKDGPIIGNAPCLACGHCTAVCPVGALALGIPRYRHRRIPNRNPVTVSFDRVPPGRIEQ